MMYSLDEVSIIPSTFTSVKSRKDIITTYTSKLPIFVAPMTCLVDLINFSSFEDSKVIPILPVYDINNKELFKQRLTFIQQSKWVALTLNEFEDTFCRNKWNLDKENLFNICIDTANGHLHDIYVATKYAKKSFPNLAIMVGNIANPKTYDEICKNYSDSVQFIRVGIGGGSGCTTSVQTGVHTSLPYLITEINKIKKSYANKPLVIADGGVNTIDRAIKCLALGADYVMMGSMFANCKEVGNYNEVKNEYYGQSSIRGQLDRFGEIRSNPEGLEKIVEINTTLNEVCSKFDAALRSAMSYCNAKTLEEFIGKPKIEYQTIKEFENYMK